MSTILLNRNFFVKLIAVIAVAALVFGITPVLDFADISISASAEEAPVYDSTLGSYTTVTDENGNTVLTAVPNEACGFRGWFLKDGTEVSYNASYTLPAGASVSDYIPVFYNFNLVKNGGFEEYAPNTNLKTGVPEDEIWGGITGEAIAGTGTDWTKSTVSNDRARTGSNSLALHSLQNCSYKDFYNLEPNTQYTLTYYFNIDADASKYMKRTYIVSGDVTNSQLLVNWEFDETEKYLAKRVYGTTDGVCAENEWKEVKMTFFTGDNTSARLLIYYHDEAKESPLYIDDVTLVKDVMAEPSYFNEDFATTTSSWTFPQTSKYSISWVDDALKVTTSANYSVIQSAPMKLKKGAKYTITFDVNLSGVTETTVSDGNANWINFSLSNIYGSYASSSNGYIINESDADTNKTLTATASNNGRTFSINYHEAPYCTHVGFSKTMATLKGLNSNSTIAITISFRNDKDTVAYLNTRLNGIGSYTIDNVKVTEDASNVDAGYIASKNAVKSLGTAIRIEGKQGMRYKTQIDKRLLTSDMYYGLRVTEYGTVAIKTDYLGNGDLVLDGMYDYDSSTYASKFGTAYSFADGTDLVYSEDENTLDFTGVLMNIAEKNWNSDYTARAYFKYIDKNGNTGVFYCDSSDIAVYPVSKAAYSARNSEGEFVESKNVRNYLYTKIISKFTDKIINISDDSAPISTNFEGIRSTIYHGVTFFPDSHGRTYTEAQAATEMDRLVDTKIDNVRTRFASQWMWTSNGWNWDSEKMTAFYKWAKMLQKRDISITLQAGWHLYDFICFYNKQYNTGITDPQDTDGDGHSSIPEVNYLHGYTDDASAKATAKYGEDANAANIEADARAIGLNLTDSEFEHYSVAAARYGEWIKQALNAFKAHGINNVKYVIPFTESGDRRDGDATYSYDEWIIMTMGLNEALEGASIRNNYKLIGPAQSIYAYQNRLSFIEYMYRRPGLQPGAEYADLVDINAMHQYTRPNSEAGYENTVYDPEASYSLAEENFTYYDHILTTVGVRDMEFWCDEYFAHAPDAKWWDNVGMQMTQFAAGLTAGINTGINRFLTWQMFDTLWDAEATHGTAIHDNTSEFSGGVHAVGTCPSLVHVDGKVCPNGASCPCTQNYNISSYIPRTTYYGINLIGKYMNNEDADVFATEVIDDATQDGGGVYVSAIRNDEGKTVILVVNTMPTTSSVEVNLEDNGIINFSRYIYDPNEIVPTIEAKSLPSDKTISLNGATSFLDIIPAQSFAIYVEGGTFNGDDVEIPFN